jgi:hypothetical protein
MLGIIDTVWIALRFYAECIIWAARGTLEKANSWFWIIGVPAVAFCGYRLGLGTLIIPDEIPRFLIFMIVTVAASWVIFLVLRLVCAPAVLCDDARKKEHALAERLKPKFKLYLQGSGVQTFKTKLQTVPQQDGPASKWVQIFVEGVTEVPLEDCEVWIIKLQRWENGQSVGELLHESVSCQWSQTSEPYAWRKTIPALSRKPQTFFRCMMKRGNPPSTSISTTSNLSLAMRYRGPASIGWSPSYRLATRPLSPRCFASNGVEHLRQ